MLDRFQIEVLNGVECPYCDTKLGAEDLELVIGEGKTSFGSCPICKRNFVMKTKTTLKLDTSKIVDTVKLCVDIETRQKK